MLTNFQTLLLEGKKVSSLAAEEPSEGLMRQQVENDPNAIGFLSNYQSDKGGGQRRRPQRRRVQQQRP